jgi:hypothetical protein
MTILLSLLGVVLAQARHRVVRSILSARAELRPWPDFHAQAWLVESALHESSAPITGEPARSLRAARPAAMSVQA